MLHKRRLLTRQLGLILLVSIISTLLPALYTGEAICLAQTQGEPPGVRREVLPPQIPTTQPSVPSQVRQPPPAQNASTDPEEPPAGQVRPPRPPAASPASRDELFSLNFDDADVYAIIQTIFGDVLKANYVVDPRVKGRVTFRAVAPVPRESILPIMEVILRLNGIGFVEDNNLYRIVPISDIAKEPSPVGYGRDPSAIPTTGKALLQVAPIFYIPSSEALRLITPFASTNAVLIDVPKGNQIIMVDTDANVKRLLRLIEVFDNEKLRQRNPQVFVYQVQNGNAKDIATLLQQIFTGAKGAATDGAPFPYPAARTALSSSGAAGSPPVQPAMTTTGATTGKDALVAGTTRIIPDEITNAIVIMATPEDYAAIRETIQQLDIVPRQVVIEGMIASVSLTDNLSLGIAALAKGSLSNLDTRFGLNPGSLNINPNALSTSGFTFVAADAAGVVRSLITALAVKSKAKLLATPHILVSDNREARIQVGQQVPLVTSETIAVANVAPQRTIQYRDIGIILKVKPRINEGGLVSLELYQEVSTFQTITLFADEQQIILNKTDASTNLVVQDNQTIVIGGLIREDTSKSRSGIPWLADLPILGWLFGSTNDDTQRQEVIILLTPHVIKNQKEAQELSNEYLDKMNESTKGRIKKEEVIK